MKQSKLCRDALDTAFEISKLIRFSPKRNTAFDRIKVENPAEEESGPKLGIRSFCPTRWTIRGDAIESIDNYDTLNRLWEECLETKLSHYNTLFGLQLSKKILKITDNLSCTLQKQAAEGLVDHSHEVTGTDPPVLPRKRRAPQQYEVGSAEGSNCTTVEDHYHHQYFEVLDITIASITSRFEQPGYMVYKNLESPIVSAANGQAYDQYFECNNILQR